MAIACSLCAGLLLAHPAWGQGVPLPAPPAPDSTPSPAVHQDLRPSIVVVTPDTATDDSVRTIRERDFDNGDRLNVIVLDSASRAACVAPDDGRPVYDELARYGTSVALRVLRTRTGVRVALFDVPHRRLQHAASFRVTWDSLGRVTRLDVHRVADVVERWITGTSGIAATRIAYMFNIDHFPQLRKRRN